MQDSQEREATIREPTMPADEDLLFGKLTVSRGFATREQIDECIQMQSMTEDPPSLGELLLYKGYLTADQHGQVLEAQKRNLERRDPESGERKEALLFGKLAVREGLLTEEEVNECLRAQAEDGETRSLGEIMVSKGYLTVAQVRDLLAKQQKRTMRCPKCGLAFTVLSLSSGKAVDCPRCKGPLEESRPSDSSRTDAEFATKVLRAVKDSVPRDVQGESRVIRPSAKIVKVKCVICDTAFEGPLDSTGRVRCPACKTTFTPR